MTPPSVRSWRDPLDWSPSGRRVPRSGRSCGYRRMAVHGKASNSRAMPSVAVSRRTSSRAGRATSPSDGTSRSRAARDAQCGHRLTGGHGVAIPTRLVSSGSLTSSGCRAPTVWSSCWPPKPAEPAPSHFAPRMGSPGSAHRLRPHWCPASAAWLAASPDYRLRRGGPSGRGVVLRGRSVIVGCHGRVGWSERPDVGTRDRACRGTSSRLLIQGKGESNGSFIWTSLDGRQWRSFSTDSSPRPDAVVAGGEGAFLAYLVPSTPDSPLVAWTSADGETWTLLSNSSLEFNRLTFKSNPRSP